jgi:hypothetical protein
MIKRLPESAQTLYAELLQKSSIPIEGGGSYVTKKIRERVYWYHQTITPEGVKKQQYIGADTPELRHQIETLKSEADASAIIDARKRLVSMLGVAGASLEKGRSARIIEKMSRIGLFESGGAMVGSYAFACYGNMLGVESSAALRRTEDIDFSVARTIDIAVQRDIPAALLDVDASLKAPKQTKPGAGPFEMVSDDGFKVEFLTTRESPSDRVPVSIAQFGVYAQPLEFMNYLLDDLQDAVVLHGVGIPVRVPNPARFAIHKLAISQMRPVGMQTKINKDIAQSAFVIEVLAQDNPGSLSIAIGDAADRGDGLWYFAQKGVNRLPLDVISMLTESAGGTLPQVAIDAGSGGFVRDGNAPR